MRRMAWLGGLSQLVLLIGGAGCQPMDSSELPPHVAGELYWLPIFEGQVPGSASEGSTDPATALSRDNEGDADDSPSAGGDDPVLSVSPVELELDWPIGSATFYVRNIGGGTLEYEATADADWVLLTDASGTSEGEARPVGVTVNAEQLRVGQHLASIVVLAGEQQAVVRVLLTVEDRPESPPALAKVLPWAECNYRNYDEETIAGLLIWQEITDTAIVSTRPRHADLYSLLHERVPGMRIIPGLKTFELLEQFDSMEGWAAIADEVVAICETSGEQVVLLENETAIRAYRRGEQEIDLDQLRAAIDQLPEGIQIIWYPSIHSPDPEVWARYEAVCRIVADVCDARFTDRSTQTPEALHDEWRQEARRRLEDISSKPTLPMLYAYAPDSGKIHWPDELIPVGLEYVAAEWGEGAEAIIYPGLDRWVEAAESLSALLAEAY